MSNEEKYYKNLRPAFAKYHPWMSIVSYEQMMSLVGLPEKMVLEKMKEFEMEYVKQTTT